MRWAFGMAHIEDFDGVYFSVQHLRLLHPDLMRDSQLIVVHNGPHTAQSQAVEAFVRHKAAGGFRSAKFIHLSDPIGTSAPRNRVFAESDAECTWQMDCHVLPIPGALHAADEFFLSRPDSRDILTGPLLLDSFRQVHTHFDPVWRDEMWGTWGTAWQCRCGAGVPVSAQRGPDGLTRFIQLAGHEVLPLTDCSACGQPFPAVPFAGHEPALQATGYRPLGYDGPPFAIPGQGLGMFACRTAAWPGFHPLSTGFGGEELYIHEKFRRQGGQAICHPRLKWVHRFGRPGAMPYRPNVLQKIRNYVLEFVELGWDLAPIHQHFVAERQRITEATWRQLIADPTTELTASECSTCGKGSAAGPNAPTFTELQSIDAAYTLVRHRPRDLDQHVDTLRELAGQCRDVVEISKRRESTVAFLASAAASLVSYNSEHADPLTQRVQQLAVARGTQTFTLMPLSDPPQIPECDLLFLDYDHTYAGVKRRLEQYRGQVRRYIVLHDTKSHGSKGEDGGPGILQALREFLRAHPEWSVIRHTPDQYGLTVLGCQPQDKPPLPGTIQIATTFAGAVGRLLKSGGATVSEAEYTARLETCSICPQRNDNRCSVCGCFLEAKAALRGEDCPIAQWPTLAPAANKAA